MLAVEEREGILIALRSPPQQNFVRGFLANPVSPGATLFGDRQALSAFFHHFRAACNKVPDLGWPYGLTPWGCPQVGRNDAGWQVQAGKRGWEPCGLGRGRRFGAVKQVLTEKGYYTILL